MDILRIALSLSSLFFSFSALSEELILWERNYKANYTHAALNNILALSEDKFGSVQLTSSAPVEQGRAFANLVANNNMDIFIGGINLARESEAATIYVPVDRGLLGFRLCLVRQNQNSFSDVNASEDLISRGILIGVGSHWPDRAIFENKGFNTVSSPIYKNLFEMLENRRFDCFSRSVAEIADELEQHSDKALKVEEDIVFIYPSAEFIFVRKEDKALQARLQYGFERALEDGSFMRIFEQHHGALMMKHRIYERKLMILGNDDMSPESLEAINQYGLASFIVN